MNQRSVQDRVLIQKGLLTPRFIAITALVYACVACMLMVADYVPEPVITAASDAPRLGSKVHVVVTATTTERSILREDATSSQHTIVAGGTHGTSVNLPVRLTIPSAGIDTAVLNPASTDIAVLDRSLLSGAVRYPGSGLPGEVANVLLFGHSSYLPVVKNKAFQAFNELGTLRVGDVVMVRTGSSVYTYGVVEVQLTRAEDTIVSFAADEPTLTLATCNTFGAKQERWVVRAVQTSVRPL